MTKRREWLFRLMTPTITLALMLVAIELALRSLPVYRDLNVPDITADEPVFRFAPNLDRYWSKGWRLEGATPVRTNNAGFVNDRDYVAGAASPVVAVIGDSYIEALMVPHEDTLQGRLQSKVGEAGRVYSFAASGAPLSQYLAWMEHARETYRPDLAVVLTIGNDFDESFLDYKGFSGPGFHYFKGQPGGPLDLELLPFRRSLKSRIASETALYFYLEHHLEIRNVWPRLRDTIAAATGGAPAKPRFANNTSVSVDERRMAFARAAIDGFLRRAANMAGLPPERVIIVVNADMDVVYGGKPQPAGYIQRTRARLIERAAAQGYTVVDMQEPMADRHRETGDVFRYPHDGHWNDVAHHLAADIVSKARPFRAVFPDLAQ